MVAPLTSGVPRVLVVDDDPTSRLMLESILRREGFAVLTANDGRSGRQVALQAQPDLILMDINMPEENGLQACAALKANAQTSEIPVLFISAIEDIDSKMQGFNVGGVDYVTKPFYPVEVLARVRLQIRMRQAYLSLVSSYLEQVKSLSNAQQLLLPQPGDLPEANFCAAYLPLGAAGGDFYDVVHAGEKVYDYYVADVSGHDLGSSLATSALKALIRQNIGMLYSPQENLSLVNRQLRSVLQEDQFITLIYAHINRTRRRLTLLNAGNPPAILVRGGQAQLLAELADEMLGMFETVNFEAHEIELQHGDRIMIFSDGLIEQKQPGSLKRRQGLQELMSACAATHTLGLCQATAKIIQTVLPERSQLKDDVVLLVIEI